MKPSYMIRNVFFSVVIWRLALRVAGHSNHLNNSADMSGPSHLIAAAPRPRRVLTSLLAGTFYRRFTLAPPVSTAAGHGLGAPAGPDHPEGCVLRPSTHPCACSRRTRQSTQSPSSPPPRSGARWTRPSNSTWNTVKVLAGPLVGPLVLNLFCAFWHPSPHPGLSKRTLQSEVASAHTVTSTLFAPSPKDGSGDRSPEIATPRAMCASLAAPGTKAGHEGLPVPWQLTPPTRSIPPTAASPVRGSH
jgi:hypothetical protein